jgi:hypothetical protein
MQKTLKAFGTLAAKETRTIKSLQRLRPVVFFSENELSYPGCHHMKKRSRRIGTFCLLSVVQTLTCKIRSSICWLPAACFVKVQNTQEVALALKIITLFQAPFAVRSGGHSPNPGFSSIDSGILIDLGSINDVVLAQDHKTVSVGPGAKWETVYEELEKHELTAVGGRVAGVGVGGLITGGMVLLYRTPYLKFTN